MYEYKNPYILDFRNIQYYGDVHKIIKAAFDFPDYYGENWDAFYDLICTDSKAERIIITGKGEMSENLKNELERMSDTLDHAKNHLAGFGIPLTYEIGEQVIQIKIYG